MKHFLLTGLLLASSLASANVFEVNDTDKVVYYAPTPTLNVNLVDLEKNGGILTMTLDYEGIATRKQNDDLKIAYPGYKLTPLVVESAVPQIRVVIAEINVDEPTRVLQAQMGPLVSVQLSLNADQVAKLKALINKRPNALQIEIPVKATIRSYQVVESYEASSSACSDLKVQTVADLVNNLAGLKKPDQIQYAQTFDSYKKALIVGCFEMVRPSSISSFKDLLKTPLRTHNRDGLKGSYAEDRLHEARINLVPKLKVEIN
jgi:hypothetical protein